jgi:hypothetical protein
MTPVRLDRQKVHRLESVGQWLAQSGSPIAGGQLFQSTLHQVDRHGFHQEFPVALQRDPLLHDQGQVFVLNA